MSTEQQHAFSLSKHFVINLLKSRTSESENQLKQKEAVNDFLMSVLKTNFASCIEKLLLNETPDRSNNSRTKSPSQESKDRN